MKSLCCSAGFAALVFVSVVAHAGAWSDSAGYATDCSALFIRAGHDIGTDFSQTGVTVPSIFSITGLALLIQYELSGDLNWRVAVLDAVSGDHLDNARVRGFLRSGGSEQRVNRFSNFLGGGVVFDGALWGALTTISAKRLRARNGSSDHDALTAAALPSEASETDIEITYRWQLNDRFALQPDIQYVINPDTNPALDNALLVGLRIELTLH